MSWWLAAAGIALAALAWGLSRCWHRGVPALLPAVTQADGTRLPARWMCPECARTWPVTVDVAARPVRKFSGYDQSKAPAAAVRAREEETARKAAAIARSGVARGHQEREATPFARRAR